MTARTKKKSGRMQQRSAGCAPDFVQPGVRRLAAEVWADRVLAIRKKLKLTQEQLAAELDVSFATVNRWENGHCHRVQRAKMKAVRGLEEKAEHLLAEKRRNAQRKLAAAGFVAGANTAAWDRVLDGLADLQREILQLRDASQ